MIERILSDLKFALRTLTRRPGFTWTAIAVLSLAVGANAAVFGLVNGILFKTIPGIESPQRLYEVQRREDGRYRDASYPLFESLKQQSGLLEDLAAFTQSPVSVDSGSGPSVRMALAVSSNYFRALGTSPYLGRFFALRQSRFPSPRDEVVISHRLWTEQFSSQDVLGRSIRLNGHSAEIVAVAPPGFSGHFAGLRADLFVPLGIGVPGMPTAEALRDADNAGLELLGRLRPDVSTASVEAELSALAAAFGADILAGDSRQDVHLEPWSPLPSAVRTPVTIFMGVLLAIVALVLAVAGINVSNMLMALAHERQRELSLRRAMGAGRSSLVRKLLTESLLLFAAAGVIGLFLASWGTRLLLALKPPLPPGFSIDLDLNQDYRVWLYGLGLTLAAAVVLTVIPLARASRGDLFILLRSGSSTSGRARTRLRQAMVVAQMALTTILLVAAGLFIGSLRSMRTLDLSLPGQQAYALSLDLELAGYSRQQGRLFYRDLEERVAGIPGVSSTALARQPVLSTHSSLGPINVPGMSPPAGRAGFDASFNTVTDGYFRTMGMPLTGGFPQVTGDEAVGVTVINRAMASRLWRGDDPIGRSFFVGAAGTGYEMRVVGVVDDRRYRGLRQEVPNFYYIPHAQRYNHQMTLHFNVADGTQERVLAAVRETVTSLDAAVPILSMASLSDSLQSFVLPQRLAAWISGVMGAFGLGLGGLGIHGLLSFVVGRRQREMGVRMALGAAPRDVLSATIVRGLRAPLLGMGIGLAISALVAQGLSSVVNGVKPTDPVTYAVVAAVLVLIALAAVLLPARRAARLDPTQALRSE